MNARFFLDTNIFAYAFDPAAPSKAQLSNRLTRRAIATGKGIISYQVVQEFFNVAFRKFPAPKFAEQAQAYFTSVLRPLLGVNFSPALLLRAMGIREKHSISWYDALIVAAAIEGECSVLYTEDFQHGREIEGVKILNPFL